MNAIFFKSGSINITKQTSSFRNPIVEVILLVFLCALLGWFIILPKKAKTDKKRAELAVAQEEQNNTEAKLTTLRKLLNTLSTSANRENVNNLDEALPLDGKTVNLQLLIASLAKDVGVTVGDISIAATTDAPVSGNKELLDNPYSATRILQKLSGSIYLIGSFNQLEEFLIKIEGSGRLIDITDLSLDPATDGNLNLRMTINAYYFAP